MRRCYLDNIRWITGILVVLYHVIYLYNGVLPIGVIGPFRDVQYQDAIAYLLYPWFMVILFVVSGVSARLSLERRTPREFLRLQTRKLLVPSTLGLLAFQWILGYYNMAIGGAFDSMPENLPWPVLYLMMAASGTGVLWYAQVLWLYCLLLIPIRKLETGKLYAACARIPTPAVLLLAVPLWAGAQVLNTPVIPVYRFGIYGTAFFLGYFVLAQESVVDRLSRRWLPLGAAAAILGTAYTVCYFGQDYVTPPVVNNLLSMAYSWTAILAIFAGMKKWADRSGPVLRWMGKRSFGLYVLHYLPMAAAAYYLNRYTALAPGLCYLLTGAAGFAGGYLLNGLIGAIPGLRWCVLGIKKEVTHVP